MHVEFFLIFELEAFLEIINHLFSVNSSLPWRHYHWLLSHLVIHLCLYLLSCFTSRDKINCMVLFASFPNGLRIFNYSFLGALLFLQVFSGPLPGFNRRVVNFCLINIRAT